MTNLQAGDAHLQYNPQTQNITISGVMRLANMQEYEVVTQYLNECLANAADNLTLDLSKLTFLNSSGITTLSLFVLQCKKNTKPTLHIIGSTTIAWQEKSLPNFNKLWNEAAISFQ